MIKEIKYGGCTATPSDYDSPDGELAAVTNLIPEDNSLKPMLPPTGLFEVPALHKVLYIHAPSANVKHFILLETDTNTNTNTLKWLDNSIVTEAQELPVPSEDVENNLTDLHTFTDADIYSVNGIGNTIVVLTSDGIHYLLWKGNEGAYLYLGTNIPEVALSFGLQGEAVRENNSFDLGIGVGGAAAFPLDEDLPDEQRSRFTEIIMAHVNKFIADNSTNAGKFMFPFLVRYAYRLYDQSLIMHSAPVLMYTGDSHIPYVNGARRAKIPSNVFWEENWRFNYLNSTRNLRVYGIRHDLDYLVLNTNELQTLNDTWGDIVKSIDIFISKPIYTFNQGGEIKNLNGKRINAKVKQQSDGVAEFENYANLSGTLCKITNSADVFEPSKQYYAGDICTYNNVLYKFTQSHNGAWNASHASPLTRCYQYKPAYKIYQETFGVDPGTNGEVNDASVIAYDDNGSTVNSFKYGVQLPEKDAESIMEDIRSCSNFYLLKSISIKDMVGQSGRTKIDVHSDYLQSLLNREVMTDDYDSHDVKIPKYSFAYNNRLNLANVNKKPWDRFKAAAMFCYANGDQDAASLAADADLFIYIKENDKDIVVKGDASTISVHGRFLYIFYPSVSAYKAVLKVGSSYYEYELKPHEMLNGAVAFTSWDNPATITPATPPQETPAAVRIYNVPNKIYTSEVNNPFLFPVKGINTVGTGTIIGVSSATKALSQGQFGQFPLYAFSTDGVWALEINNEGAFVKCHPVTRDVCTAPESITQLDKYINFATDRGIMMLEGSSTICISDEINNDNAITFSGQPTIELLELLPFRQFLTQDEGCRMLYDYIHQRVILYNASCNYAYIYSLKDKKWGMMQNKLLYHLNAYPEALAVIRENGQDILVNMSEEDIASLTDPVTGEINGVQATLLTRPLKLDLPDGLKTVDTIIQRGMFDYADASRTPKPVQQILYGSRDLYNWHLVWSSKDQYLRGFRGTPYKYFRLALICDLRPDEFLMGCTVQYTPRYTNQPR